jgi:hypothetical protein
MDTLGLYLQQAWHHDKQAQLQFVKARISLLASLLNIRQ